MSDVIESGQHNRIQFNNLSILPNAEMADPKNIEKDKIETVETPIVNVHGSLDETPSDGIHEKQKLVISTSSMNTDQWKLTRVYASTSEFLYFNKLLQIPFLFLNVEKKIKFKDLFEKFINEGKSFPCLNKIVNNFFKHSENITKGGSEFIFKEGFLDIYWPPGEFEYINLVISKTLDAFYKEAEKLYSEYLDNEEDKYILSECFKVNRSMLRVFGEKDDETIDLKYNILEYYKSIIQLEKSELKLSASKIIVIKSDNKYHDIQQWMREVIWYGHRSGKYLCKVKNFDKDEQVPKPQTNHVGPYIA